MNKPASTDFEIHELISGRWSPYGFDPRSISDDDLCSLFEAARWAASSYNEQPWSFIVATRDDQEQFDRLLSCLVEFNQTWASQASALVLCCTSLTFSKNGKPNAAAHHDLGLASASLSLEATSRGITVHQMIGIDPEKARIEFEVPEGIEPLTVIAIGYPAAAESTSDAWKERDTARRARKRLGEFVFSGSWGKRSEFIPE